MTSGVFAANYYAKFGANSIWLPLLTVGIIALTIFKGLDFARRNNCYDFDSLSHALFKSKYKYFNPIFTMIVIIASVISLSLQFALGSSLLEQLLGCGYWLGCLIMGVAFLSITVLGSSRIRGSNVLMSFFLVGILILLMIFSVNKFPKEIGSIFYNWNPGTGSIIGALVMALGYGFGNSTNFLPMLSLAEKIDSKEKVKLATIISSVLNYVVIICTVLILLPFGSEFFEGDTPILRIISQYFPYLKAIYVILLFLAVLSSAPAQIYNQTKRWSKSVKMEDGWIKTLIISIIVCIPAVILAQQGLQTIVSKVITYIGYLAIPTVFVPIVFFTNDNSNR